MTDMVGILGNPLNHSLSPAFQQAAFDYYNLDVRYMTWQTTKSELTQKIRELSADRYLGANVTIPYKEDIMAHLDIIDPKALRMGAVNTIAKSKGALVGHNTDGYGFLSTLTSQKEFDFEDRQVLLLGAGGAARAAAHSLSDKGIKRLTIANRTIEKAQTICSEFSDIELQIVSSGISEPEIIEIPRSEDLIINATSIGMKHSGTEEVSLLSADQISPKALVFDMVYNPPITSLLREARRANARIVNGLPMLIHQGALSFKLWTGLNPPIEIMHKAGLNALNSTTNGSI